jgi:hypothetical protein
VQPPASAWRPYDVGRGHTNGYVVVYFGAARPVWEAAASPGEQLWSELVASGRPARTAGDLCRNVRHLERSLYPSKRYTALRS